MRGKTGAFVTGPRWPIYRHSQEPCEPMKNCVGQRHERLAAVTTMAAITAVAALPLLFFAGCKKEAEPAVEVTVQAEKPEQGSISEHIEADAILTPLAQAAIAPRISAPVKKFYVQRGDKV